MKEWKSKKELDDFILKKNRYEEIGFVTLRTLKKWGIEMKKEWEIDDNFYIVQNGNSISFHVKWYLRKFNNNEMQYCCKMYNINDNIN